MTIEIIKDDWKKFFDELSGELARWQTSIETVGRGFGRQFPVDKSSFVGITAETNQSGQIMIELMSSDPYNHQTHTICNPNKVSYSQNETPPGRLIVIEGANGETTVINLEQPPPAELSFGECQNTSVSYWENQESL